MRYRGRRSYAKEPNIALRFFAVLILFAVFALIFTGRLIYFQFAARATYETPVIADGNVRTVKVSAERGRILDRNGEVLVGNEYTYDMQIEYGAIPETRKEAYEVYLKTLNLMDAIGIERASDYSPFEGTYPNLTYKAEAKDESSQTYAKLKKIMNEFFVGSKSYQYKDAETAIASVDAVTLCRYIGKNYGILTEKNGVWSSDYSEADAYRLICLRYNMAAADFGSFAPYILAKNIDERVISAVKERRLTGITFAANATRKYYYEKSNGERYASHILGTVGSITAENADYYTERGYRLDAKVGRSGCEYAFEEYLKGTAGELAIVENDDGFIIDTYWIKEPVAGKDILLTIDINVQVAAEDALYERIFGDDIAISSAKGGAAVAVSPENGEILALASTPEGEINRALSAYFPGSTFKVGVGLAALTEHIITTDTKIQTDIAGYNKMKCSHVDSPYSATSCCGNINIVSAIERSCNYFFADIGDELGVELLAKYAKLYGFGEETGIEIGLNAKTDEATGRLPYDTAYMSAIGQLCTATPLQVANYTAMFGADGVRYETHLLLSVNNPDGSVFYKPETKVAANLVESGINAADIQTVKQGMRQVVYGESASSYVSSAFRSASYKVAGKTGTAQVAGQVDNAWFTAFSDNSGTSKIAVTCFIEEGYTGGLASWVVRQVMDAYNDNVSPLGE